MTATDRRSRALAFAAAHVPELVILGFGVVLRLTLHFSYPPMGGYDGPYHWEVVDFIAKTGELPRTDQLFEAFHPPLFYVIGAVLVRLFGAGPEGVQWISILSGIARLSLTWLALELYVGKRNARLLGLGLAAVLPVSVQIDGTLNAEALSNMLGLAVIILLPRAFEAEPKRRWFFCAFIGLILSLQLLAKISAGVTITAVGAIVALRLLLVKSPLRERAQFAAPFLLLPLIPLLLTNWYFGKNVRDHGKPFLSGFEMPMLAHHMAGWNHVALFDRRPVGFLVYWDSNIFEHPYTPSAVTPAARYWPVVTVGTFVDYWNYSFSGLDPKAPTPMSVNTHPMTPEVMTASRRSAVGGTFIAAVTVIAFIVCLRLAWRKRDWGKLSLLAITAGSVAAGIYFSIKYPLDGLGVTKATYVQHGIAPLYGVFGLAGAWAFEERRRRPLFVLMLSALALVTAYTFYCRLRLPLLPL